MQKQSDIFRSLADIVSQINRKMAELNQFVTNGLENPPTLSISYSKDISFGTAGNTSEGTACKSMVLFDLAMLTLTDIPAIIHDGNILHSISKEHFERLLQLYAQSGKQVFIAVDQADSNMLKQSTILHLSEEKRQFGFAWSRKNA